VTTPLSPNALNRGATAQTVTITGTHFDNAPGTVSVTISGLGDTGVSTGIATFVSATQITVPVTVTFGATLASNYGLTVTNGDGTTASCANCFTVNPAPAPTVSSPSTASPQTISQTGTTTFTINGTGFQPGVSVTTSGDNHFAVTSYSYISSTQIQVTMTNSYTNSGSHKANLIIANPDNGTVTSAGCVSN
jgi:hypothetical protein